MKRRWRLVGLGAAVLLVLTALTIGSEWPAWRWDGADALHVAPVSYDAGETLCPDQASVLELRGDSHVAGGRMDRPGPPYGAVLQTELGGGRKVISKGFGGDTAALGEARWLARPRHGDVVLLAYGTNDAAPRGWLTAKQPVPITQFTASLRRQAESLRADGARVALIAAPPGGSPAINERLAPYRTATGQLGRELGVSVFDPAHALARCEARQPVLGYDALHLTRAGHQCFGAWLARRLCPPATAPRP